MRIPLLLTLPVAIAGCAVRKPAPKPTPKPAQTASSYCSQPLRSEAISSPLAPGAVPPGVSVLAKDRYKADLAQQPPTGAWYQGSDGSYLFCSYRLNAGKACGSERQFYRLEDGSWQTAEHDMMVCG